MTGISRYVRCLYTVLQQTPGVSAAYFNGRSCSGGMPSQAEPAAWAKATERIWRLPDAFIAGMRALHFLTFERKLRKSCGKTKYTLYHETGFVPPALDDIPVIYTMYDISLMKFRAQHPRERAQFFDFFFKRRRHYASHILTISEFMKQEIIAHTGFSPDCVTAIPLAADHIFSLRNDQQISAAVTALHIPKDYILCVGTLEPRKNISLIIQAFAQSKTDIPLVLTGWQGWGYKKWWNIIKEARLEKRIFITNYISDEMLACLYSGARVLVYPSLYEGFGLPVLEAMSCGCPVICSRTSSLPEVSGDAAVLIDPYDPDDCAQAVEKVVCDTAYRNDLQAKGYKRAAEFSWQNTAIRTLEVFDSVARQSTHHSHK